MASLDHLTDDPPNAAVPLASLDGGFHDQAAMFQRNNFAPPPTLPVAVAVSVPGRPDRTLTVADLDAHPRVELPVLLECAGHGRTLMEPVPDGTPWGLGAASHVVVTGHRLADVLGDLPSEVVDVVFTGADRGEVDPDGHIHYQFSIDRDTAISDRPVLATHIGGEPLTPRHGAPVRLVVPGDYAMKSVKWLTRIEAVTEPFEGHFVRRYRYYGDASRAESSPVGPMAVRSVIASPADGSVVVPGPLEVVGTAWSGAGPITDVVVSVDGLDPIPATLLPSGAVTRWQAVVEVGSGQRTVAARATDVSGATQPLTPVWNANGFANNVVHRVVVAVG